MHLHVLIQLLLEVPDLRCALLLDAGPSRSWALPCSWCSSCSSRAPRACADLVLPVRSANASASGSYGARKAAGLIA